MNSECFDVAERVLNPQPFPGIDSYPSPRRPPPPPPVGNDIEDEPQPIKRDPSLDDAAVPVADPLYERREDDEEPEPVPERLRREAVLAL